MSAYNKFNLVLVLFLSLIVVCGCNSYDVSFPDPLADQQADGNGSDINNPDIASVSPEDLAPGMNITINGIYFGAERRVKDGGNSYVSFQPQAGGTPANAAAYPAWSDRQIICTVPPLGTSGVYQVNVHRVTASGVLSTDSTALVTIDATPLPEVTALEPATIPQGAQLTINGRGFGASRRQKDNNESFVSFFPVAGGAALNADTYDSWTNTRIVCTTPALVSGAQYVVVVNWVNLNGTYSSSATATAANTLACRARLWGTAALIDAGPGTNASEPRVAFDPAGNAMCVFVQILGGNTRIYARRYDAGTGSWDLTATLIDAGANNASEPQVAIDFAGNALCAFTQFNGVRNAVFTARYDVALNTWAAAVQRDDALDNAADQPQVAFDADGNAMCVFRQSVVGPPATPRVLVNMYDAATDTWGGAAYIDEPTGTLAGSPHTAYDSQGNAFCVFQQQDAATNLHVYANRYDAAGDTWLANPAVIDAGTVTGADNPRVAFDAAGNALCVYRENDTANWRVYANRYPAAGPWAGAGPIDAGAGSDAGNPRLAIDGAGNAFCVFPQDLAGTARIYANRYDGAGNTWMATPDLIDAGPGNNSATPEVAFDAAGNALCVFVQSDGIDDRIYANGYNAGGTWMTAGIIDAVTGFDAAAPQVDFNNLANALCVFVQSDGTNTRIYENLYQ